MQRPCSTLRPAPVVVPTAARTWRLAARPRPRSGLLPAATLRAAPAPASPGELEEREELALGAGGAAIYGIPRAEWLRLQTPARYLGNEFGAVRKPWGEADIRFSLTYPEIYEVGASNLGHIILYSILNQQPGLLCDRAYFPGKKNGAGGRAGGDGHCLSLSQEDGPCLPLPSSCSARGCRSKNPVTPQPLRARPHGAAGQARAPPVWRGVAPPALRLPLPRLLAFL